jgi:monovalent cation/hydrogen antiporter
LTGFLIPVRLLGSKFLLNASRSPNIENLLRIGPMLMFEWILSLLFAAVVLTNLAERLAVPYPSLLALAGAGLAFLPFAPQIRIEPELALALFVAPALLDAAFDTSPRDLRSNAIPIASMAVVAVVLTAIAVAYLGWRFAGMPIAAAIALGAIASPPDPVAAARPRDAFLGGSKSN